MLHILTITVTQIIHAFALPLAGLPFKKEVNLAVLDFLHFVSGRKTSKLYLRFMINKM